MEKSLRDEVVLVTGSGRRNGIGYGIARKLAQKGASVIVTDICRRSQPDTAFEVTAWSELSSIAEEFTEFGNQHLAVKADITDANDVSSLIEKAEAELGKISILINNAGICVVKPLIETSPEEWEASMKVNAFGTFLCSVLVARQMISHNINGQIVNISSISGKEGWPDFGAYTASKFAVVGFTQSFAREMAPHGITVNAVCPGLIHTGMNDVNLELLAEIRNSTPEEIDKAQVSRVPLGRYGTSEDVADVVAFLVSPAASYMTGQSLNVTGGLMVH